jgi:hypothetical protein
MKQLFRIGLLLVAFLLGTFAQLSAQSTSMSVFMNDGTIQTFLMQEEDQVYFSDNTYLVIEQVSVSSVTNISLAEIRKITCEETMDIPENQAPSVIILPNPVHDVMTLHNLNGNQKVQIYSISGQLVRSFEANGDQIIDVSGLSIGLYLVRTQSCTLKMIKL